jgi:hypothetical protein
MILFLLGLLIALLYTRRACRIAVDNYAWNQKLLKFQEDINMGRTPIYQQISTLDLRLEIRTYLVQHTRLPDAEVERATSAIMARIHSRNPTWHKA